MLHWFSAKVTACPFTYSLTILRGQCAWKNAKRYTCLYILHYYYFENFQNIKQCLKNIFLHIIWTEISIVTWMLQIFSFFNILDLERMFNLLHGSGVNIFLMPTSNRKCSRKYYRYLFDFNFQNNSIFIKRFGFITHTRHISSNNNRTDNVCKHN